jgi:predicted nucleic acid-binding protein
MSPSVLRQLLVAEPPAVWLVRPPVVVDCSALAAWLFQEPEMDQAAAMLSGKTLHAPNLMPYEIANVARKKVKSGANAEHIMVLLDDFAAHRIDWHAPPPQSVLVLANRWSLSAYDAAYLWLAAELKAPLATFDQRLAEAARQHLGALE